MCGGSPENGKRISLLIGFNASGVLWLVIGLGGKPFGMKHLGLITESQLYEYLVQVGIEN